MSSESTVFMIQTPLDQILFQESTGTFKLLLFYSEITELFTLCGKTKRYDGEKSIQ